MENARGNGPPPPDLTLNGWCERYSALPQAGGVLDQDYFQLLRMSFLANVRAVLSKLGNMQGSQIHNLTEAERMILKALRDMGFLYG